MKKSAKYLALAEAILLLSFSYLSCSDADEQETTGPDTHPAIETAAEVEEETSDPRLIPDVEIMKQNDMVFRIYGNPPNEGGHWSVHDMVTDDLDGTVLNDSIYERNRFLEETYGFSIDVTTASSMQQEIANLVSSGDNTIHTRSTDQTPVPASHRHRWAITGTFNPWRIWTSRAPTGIIR